MAPKAKIRKNRKFKSRSGTSCADMKEALRKLLAEATTQLATATAEQISESQARSVLELNLKNSQARVIDLKAELASSDAKVAQLNRDLLDERDRRQEIIEHKMDMISKVGNASKMVPKLFDKPTSARTSDLGSVELSINRLLLTPKRKATSRDF